MNNLPLGKSLDSPIGFKAGTVIFSKGESSKYLYLLKTGVVSLLSENGTKLVVIKNCKEKDILNEVSVLTNKPVGFSAIAKTDIELVLIDQKDILAVLKNGPTWIPEMFETLCERLKSTEEMILEHNLLAGEKDPSLVLTKEDEKKYIKLLSEYNDN